LNIGKAYDKVTIAQQEETT